MSGQGSSTASAYRPAAPPGPSPVLRVPPGTYLVLLLALGVFAWRVSRAVLLYRAGAAALKHGSKDPRGKAGLKIVDALTGADEPWYRALMWWRKTGED